MDVEYLRAHPDKLPLFIEHQRIRCTPIGGGDTSVVQRLTLDDGADVFAKFSENGPPEFLASERAGLEWLCQADAPVPQVLCGAEELLVTEWIEPGASSEAGAEELGRKLARTHKFGANAFGAAWRGYIGALPMDNDCAESSWPEWFAARRLAPYLRTSRDRGALDASDAAKVEALVARLDVLSGPPEPIARLHGDLWPGNVHWGADGRAWLIDPAAHGGHRETDLATLHLWGGVPRLDRITAAYEEVWPLADGWRDRIPLHQLFLLLVHTALFGRAYRGQVMEAVRGR
ncbi:MAG: fructosamine kinase family protein [Stackebrandtia sp.]